MDTVDFSRRALLGAALASAASACTHANQGSDEPNEPLHDEVTAASAVRLARAIRRQQVSCVDVVDAYLRRVDAVNPRLNAIVQVNADARSAAMVADRVLKQGGQVGALHGVPFTVKDSFDVAGSISTAGTTGRRSFVPSRDATVVARLRAAGAIMLGKTNTPELTLSYETDNLVYGRTNNPYDVQRTSGGSSGGAAAALAAGLTALDVGSDTGGSIRVPAHFCGIAGLKPTSGRIPRTGHILPPEGVFQSFTQPGPMVRRVEDLIALLPILAGSDGRDPWIAPAPVSDPRSIQLRGLRVAMHGDNGVRTAEASCVRAVRAAANALADAGCVVTEFAPRELARMYDAGNRLWRVAGPATVRRLLAASKTTEVSPPLRPWLTSPGASSEDWTSLLEEIDRARAQALEQFERFDAILCPPCAFPALEHGATLREDLDSAFSYSEVFNYLGWPAAVVRGGTTDDRLPVGVQIVSKPWREDVVLALAARLEDVLGGWMPPTP